MSRFTGLPKRHNEQERESRHDPVRGITVDTKNSVGPCYQLLGVLEVTLLNGPLWATYGLTLKPDRGRMVAPKLCVVSAFG
jgi:hypothetical protein